MVKRRKNTNSAKKEKITKEDIRMEAEALEKRGTHTKKQKSTGEGSERSITDPRPAAEKNMETWSRKEESESGKTKVEKPNT